MCSQCLHKHISVVYKYVQCFLVDIITSPKMPHSQEELFRALCQDSEREEYFDVLGLYICR